MYNFIGAKQNDIGGAVLIYIAGQPHSHECTRASNTFKRENWADVNITRIKREIAGSIPGIYIFLSFLWTMFYKWCPSIRINDITRIK